MITKDELNAIRQRCDKATPGPWDETWRDIPGFNNYQVSCFGNVRSYLKKGNHKNKGNAHPRLLRQARRGGGYPTVSLPDRDGKYRHRSVHSLVLLAFVGECPEGKEVAHLNGIPTDNRFSNLAYVTHKENEAHKVAHGTSPVGENNGQSNLLGWQVAEIKFLSSKSVPQGKIAALFGISHKYVSAILNGKAWAHIEARTDIPRLLDEVNRLKLAIEAMPDEDCVCYWHERNSKRRNGQDPYFAGRGRNDY